MKGTLRKVNDGIVFTIDERPKIGDFGYNTKIGKCLEYDNRMYLFVDYSDHKILASTFGVGLELCIVQDNEIVLIDLYQGSRYTIAEFIDNIDNNTEYLYTIELNKLIINL